MSINVFLLFLIGFISTYISLLIWRTNPPHSPYRIFTLRLDLVVAQGDLYGLLDKWIAQREILEK